MLKKLNIYHFILVSVILFLMPFFKQWDLILFGERVTGTASHMTYKGSSGSGAITNEPRSTILYTYEGICYTTYGPENVKYDIGEEIPLIVNKKDPTDHIIATFKGFYLHARSIPIMILFFVWVAVYSTLIQVRKGYISFRK